MLKSISTRFYCFITLTACFLISSFSYAQDNTGPDADLRTLLIQAEEAFKSKNYKMAESLADSCISLNSALNLDFKDIEEAYYLKGMSQMFNAEHEEAEKSLIVSMSHSTDNYSNRFDCQIGLARNARYQKDFEKAAASYSNAIEIGLKYFDLRDPEKLKNIAICPSSLYSIGYRKEAALYLDRIEAAAIIKEQKLALGMFSVYNLKGVLAKNQGLYDKAEENYNMIESILKQHHKTKSSQYILLLINYGVLYKHKSQLQKSMQYYQKALDLQMDLDSTAYKSLSNILMNLAQIQGRIKEKENAISNVEKAIVYMEDSYGRTSHRYLRSYFIREEIYNTLGLEGYLLKEEDEIDSLQIQLIGKLDVAYLKLKTKLFTDAGKYEKAEKNLNLCMSYLKEDMESIIGSEFAEPINIYTAKGDLYIKKYADSGDLSDLEKSADGYKKAIDILVSTRTSNSYVNSAPLHIYKFNFLLRAGMDVFLELFKKTGNERYVQNMLLISTLTKNIELESSFNNQKGLKLTSIPEHELLKGNKLQDDIDSLRTILLDINDDTDSLWTITYDILNNNLSLQQAWFDQVEKNYPQYYDFKYGYWDKSISELKQRFAKKSELFFDFVKLDSSLYVISVSEKKVTARRLPYDDTLQELTLNVQSGLHLDNNTFDESCKRLYDLLMHEELTSQINSANNIVISADHQLSLLSFEMLGADKRLIEDFNVRYIHSLNMRYPENKTASSTLASFVPIYEEERSEEEEVYALLVRDGEWYLPGAIEESKEITNLLEGDLYIGEDATENNFRIHADEYSVLHLSMHSIPKDTSSLENVLLFNSTPDTLFDNILTESEIYNLELNSDLVVLSACNTGYGKYYKGKGVKSLSNAFVYAGVPSLIMSYWKVPDKSTSQIMIAFYRNLNKGKTKSESLRQAKLEYVNNAQSDALRHPHYWAGFVLIGNDDPIRFTSPVDFKLMILLLIITVSVIWIGKSLFSFYSKRA